MHTLLQRASSCQELSMVKYHMASMLGRILDYAIQVRGWLGYATDTDPAAIPRPSITATWISPATIPGPSVAATFRSPWRAQLAPKRVRALLSQRHGDLKVAATPEAMRRTAMPVASAWPGRVQLRT